jgi:hypothetical protein
MAKKTFKTNNLVIVCEGTETEFSYFEYLASKVESNFDSIRVIPSPEDRMAALASRADGKRRMKKLEAEGKSKDDKLYYVTLAESEADIGANYAKYKQAPAKYVREAYLHLKDYTEAWAVYDLDDTDDRDHKVHKRAKELVDSNPSLYKAFSAYSFEEWILLNYIRCTTAFDNSAFKEKKGLKNAADELHYECKGRHCVHKPRCSAGCIGDSLVDTGIADSYSKNEGKEYAQKIFENEHFRHRAYVNAAWSRSLKDDIFYECNPYTDVDKLVMRLMNEKIDIHWVKLGTSFCLDGHTLTIEDNEGVWSVSHQGNETCIISQNQIFWCDDNYEKKAEAITSANINFTTEDNGAKSLTKSEGCSILCLKGRKQEFYFEID